MAFVLAAIYVAITLLSPAAFGVPPEVRLALIIACLALPAALIQAPSSPVISRQQVRLIGLWYLAACLSLVFIYVTEAFNTFILLIPFLTVGAVILFTCRSLSHLKWLSGVLFCVCAFIIVMGFYQMHAGIIGDYVLRENIKDTGDLGRTIATTDRIRGLGIINDPNDFGQVLVCTLPLLWLRWKPGNAFSNFLFTVLPALLLTYGIYLTRSRGTLLALLAILVFAFKDRLGVVGSTLLATVTLVGFLALGVTGGGDRGVANDDGDRVGMWSNGFEAFKHHPLFGVGLGNIEDYVQTHLTVHNSYVLSLSETGLVGYCTFIAVLVSCWYGLTQEMKPSADGEGVTTAEPVFPWIAAQAQRHLPVPAMAGSAAYGGAPASIASASLAHSATSPLIAAPLQAAPGSTPRIPLGMPPPEQIPANELQRAAFLVRLSLVALLVSSFFLSRTYAMSMFIFLSIPAVTIALSPAQVSPRLGKLLKLTLLTAVGTIALLDIIIRVHTR